jgi:hypothetical protein
LFSTVPVIPKTKLTGEEGMKTKLFKVISVLVLLSMLIVPVNAQFIPPTDESKPVVAKGTGPVQES